MITIFSKLFLISQQKIDEFKLLIIIYV